MNKYSFVQGIS